MTSRTMLLCGLLAVCAALAGCSCKEYEDQVLAVDRQVASLQEQVVAREADVASLKEVRTKLEADVQNLTDERDRYKAQTEVVTFRDITQTVNFGVDQYQVQESMASTLTDVATIARQNPDWNLYVLGFSDRAAQNAETQYFIPTAWELAAFRATHVARWLIEKEGLAADHVVACSLGANRPVAANDTEAGRAQNRRVTFFLRAPEPVAAAADSAAADSTTAPAGGQ